MGLISRVSSRTYSMSNSRRRGPNSNIPHGFLTRTIYTNSLPSIPFEPKFLECQFEQDRFTRYNTTSLEKQHRIELHVPRNLGIHIDLINPNAYKSNPSKRTLHPHDEALLEDDRTAKDTVRSSLHNQATNIFRRSEIISSKNKHYGKFGQEIIERQLGVGHQIKKTQRKHQQQQPAVPEYKNRTAQIEAIEKGFEACKDTASEKYQKHHHKKDVYATEYLPIFPDFETWKHPCCQVVFDTNPAQASGT